MKCAEWARCFPTAKPTKNILVRMTYEGDYEVVQDNDGSELPL
jgi:hypothetical protein